MPDIEADKRGYALISVYDKSGIVDLAGVLVGKGYQILSTRETAKTLEGVGLPVTPVDLAHMRRADELRWEDMGVVVVNLNPFERAADGVSRADLMEQIDIGGSALLRAAAKNARDVLVVGDPQDYPAVIEALLKGEVTQDFRQMLAARAFEQTAFYDAMIAQALRKDPFPRYLAFPGKLVRALQGDNPDQQAALYEQPGVYSPFSKMTQYSGEELGMVNLRDINAGWELLMLFNEPAAVIIRHHSPSGIALGVDPKQAFSRAINADPVLAFGGVAVLNRKVDLKTARVVGDFNKHISHFGQLDVIAAPAVDSDAIRYLARVRNNTAVYAFGKLPTQNPDLLIKQVRGGFVAEIPNKGVDQQAMARWEVVTKAKPTPEQLEQMRIGWNFILRTPSNTVLVMDPSDPMTVGIGSGQPSCAQSTEIAIRQAGSRAQGAVLVSDGFFPRDSVRLAAVNGIGAIVQPGSSVGDQALINTANGYNIPMVFTRTRASWHL